MKAPPYPWAMKASPYPFIMKAPPYPWAMKASPYPFIMKAPPYPWAMKASPYPFIMKTPPYPWAMKTPPYPFIMKAPPWKLYCVLKIANMRAFGIHRLISCIVRFVTIPEMREDPARSHPSSCKDVLGTHKAVQYPDSRGSTLPPLL